MRPFLDHPVPAARLAAELDLELVGESVDVTMVAPLSGAGPGSLTFVTRTLSEPPPVGTCIIAATPIDGRTCLLSERPRLDFVRALQTLDRLGGFDRDPSEPEIHPEAVLASGVSLGTNVTIGARTRIGANVRIGDDTVIGADCVIKANSVIGEDGFGFERDENGRPVRMLHLGGVILKDRIEIGALNTVVRGALAPTVVESDVKTDDHVHIAHNCHIGARSLLTAHAELSGSVTLGEEVWLSPNVSIMEGVTIGDRALVGLGAVVLKDVEADTVVAGSPARVLTKK